MTSKFAVRRLVLTFMPPKDLKDVIDNLGPFLHKRVSSVVGYTQRINDFSMYLYLPHSCDVFDLRDAILDTIKGREFLKGLKFKIDVCAKLP